MSGVPSRAQASEGRRSWRLAGWCAGAVFALATAVAALRSEIGIERAKADFAAMTGQAKPDSRSPELRDQERARTPAPPADKFAAWSDGVDGQLRRQAELIRALAEQRDGLAEKVGAMERQLSDLGGLLSRATARLESEAKNSRDAAAAASSSAAAAAAAARLAQTKLEAKREVADAAATGTVAAPAGGMRTAPSATAQGTMPASVPAHEGAPSRLGQIPGMSAAGPEFAATVAASAAAPAYTGTIPMPAAGATAAAPTPPLVRPFPADAAAQAAAMASAQVGAVDNAPAPPTAPKPQNHPATLSALSHAPPFQSNPLMTAGIFDEPAELNAVGTEFAVDLGGALSVETLRARWNSLRTSEAPLFDNLKPLVALKEGGKSGQDLHLIVGPLPSAAATARVCAMLSGSGVSCRPSTFEGQHLATR